MGTPAYMSPEQILNRPLDARSDLFSFALVAYELFTGQRPFPGTNFKEVVNGILHSPPVPISTVLTDVPLQVEVEFEHALAKKADDRFDSALETIRVFETAFFGSEGGSVRSSGAIAVNPGKGRGTEWKSIGVPDELKNEVKKSTEPPRARPSQSERSMRPPRNWLFLLPMCGSQQNLLSAILLLHSVKPHKHVLVSKQLTQRRVMLLPVAIM